MKFQESNPSCLVEEERDTDCTTQEPTSGEKMNDYIGRVLHHQEGSCTGWQMPFSRRKRARETEVGNWVIMKHEQLVD